MKKKPEGPGGGVQPLVVPVGRRDDRWVLEREAQAGGLSGTLCKRRGLIVLG